MTEKCGDLHDYASGDYMRPATRIAVLTCVAEEYGLGGTYVDSMAFLSHVRDAFGHRMVPTLRRADDGSWYELVDGEPVTILARAYVER